MDRKKKVVMKELQKPARRNYPRQKYNIRGLDETWQADLTKRIPYATENKGHVCQLDLNEIKTQETFFRESSNPSTVKRKARESLSTIVTSSDDCSQSSFDQDFRMENEMLDNEKNLSLAQVPNFEPLKKIAIRKKPSSCKSTKKSLIVKASKPKNKIKSYVDQITEDKANKINECLLKYMIANNIDFNSVKSKYISKLIQYLRPAYPQFLPDTNLLQNQIFDNAYQEHDCA
ncbi:uncharacterized protein LOC106636415 [Copidosoma floridanum]|uniref:uncharacterized protein LOC106636415 n=1 Tax=Copidosoma floridanum TaxID=29053 RepID=UPI0006C952B7|nr:uncharacterized protein LOC106636415 [Copidosoma floridanum]